VRAATTVKRRMLAVKRNSLPLLVGQRELAGCSRRERIFTLLLSSGRKSLIKCGGSGAFALFNCSLIYSIETQQQTIRDLFGLKGPRRAVTLIAN
jgi:hypothetical protein